MNRLVSTNLKSFQRWKTAFFCLVGLIGFLAIVVVISAKYAKEITDEGQAYADQIVTYYLPFMGFMCGIIASSVGGNDYKDGTIRNKIIAGYSRRQIFISNFITTAIYSIVFYLVTFLVAILMTVPFFELGANTDGDPVIYYTRNILLGLIPVISASALYNLVVMLNESKTKGIIFCLMGGYVLMMVFASIMLEKVLPSEFKLKDIPEAVREDPEFYFRADDENAIIKNDKAYSEPVRSIVVFLEDTFAELNFTRIMYYIDDDFHYCLIRGIDHKIVLVIFNTIYVLGLNVIGCEVFKRKRLK